MFFAFLVLFVCKLLTINILVVEAAGVGLWGRVENKQVIDSKGLPETQETANTRF
jgi:hypothetical protein